MQQNGVLSHLITLDAPTPITIAMTLVLPLLIACVTLVDANRADLLPETVQQLFAGLSCMLDKINPWYRHMKIE